MTIIGIIIAVVAVFLVFKFISGLIKFGVLALIVIALLWFVSGGMH